VNVGIIDLDGGEEPVLRPYLESLGCRVTVYRIGRPNDVVAVMSGAGRYAEIEHLLIDCHGGESGILMPELAPGVAEDGEPTAPWGPAQVRKFCRLSGASVLANGCLTGTPEMGAAFIEAGAAVYLAPAGYPHGREGLALQLRFYYELLHRGLGLPDAFSAAARSLRALDLYRIYWK